ASGSLLSLGGEKSMFGRKKKPAERQSRRRTISNGDRYKINAPVKKIVWCLWLVLAMPSMAFGWQRRDGTYYCTVKFAGGLEYNNTLKEWQGAILKPSRNFMMKLTFRQPTKSRDRDEFDKGQIDDNDEYDVTITEEGDASVSCLESREKLPSINKYAFLECSRMGLIDYK